MWMSKVGVLAVSCMSLAITSCSDEPGRVRATKMELVGIYEATFEKGHEQLELNENGRFTQTFKSRKGVITAEGRWEIENHFMDGTDVILHDALVAEDRSETSRETSTRTLNVHRKSGQLVLALNEAFEWYYTRVK
jgi:hypothetical protein